MEDYEIYFLDEEDEPRNAVRDHRTQGSRPSSSPPPVGIIRRPATSGARPSGSSQVVVARPVNGQRPLVVKQERGGLAGLSTGELIEVGTQVLAAIQPLPAAPVASGHSETDVGNLILYQSALAAHAKRDEQLRTLGSLVGKLLD